MKIRHSYVVSHRFLGRIELFVVGPSAGLMEQSARDPSHQQLVVDTELDHRVQRPLPLLQQRVQLQKLLQIFLVN